MKTRLITLAVAAALFTGCNKSPGAAGVEGTYKRVMVWVDPGTSCHYLLTVDGHMTPRLHTDGVQVCMGEDKLGAQLPDYHEG